ncbi:hypothetical protein KJS94_12660 [Flavihumibacter rivuli]|uniref:hypothetical protein n=1 Tax=Flavihumibacter rivuli TaxID=2838156 RepID=UPI001BDE4A52|nr:hypothetical protein [Flavihumibacter rivuli]ULQ55495.1 hypothetical protein KJS94_12660 [Flavihumibacter rivuli]
MNRQLHYHNMGRGGYVIYRDDKGEIKLDFEFGGGDCVAIIFLPTADQWLTAYNRSAEEKEGILTFIAQCAIRDQVPNGRAVISDAFIELFHS